MNSKNSLIIWKINLSRKIPIISGMRAKNCQKNLRQKLNVQRSSPEVFLKNIVLESLFLLACNFVKKETPAQLFSYKFCEFSGRLLLSIAIMWNNVGRMRATIFWSLIPPHFNDLSLTILREKLPLTVFNTKIHWNTKLAASDIFHTFTQSSKFF